jgi:hypothetical protein
VRALERGGFRNHAEYTLNAVALCTVGKQRQPC